MPAFEYKVVPAPAKGTKAKGVRSTSDRFALALQTIMNDLGADGWEYQRTDTLPCEERDGLMSKATHFQHMLVFRRAVSTQSNATPETVIETPPTPLLTDRSDDVTPTAPAAAIPAPAAVTTPQSDPAPVAVGAVPSAAPRPNMAAE